MTTDPSASKQSQEQIPAADPGLEVSFHNFWEKNRTYILGVVAVALVAIVVRESWQYFAAQHELSVREEYAKVTDRPEQLATFAAANSSHPLAGVAYLRIADAKYAANDFRAAAENYAKAVPALKDPAIVGRARLGVAMSQLNGGDKAAGEAALKAVASDASLLSATRAEASFHLATLAHEAGNAAEVGRLIGELAKLDATGVWSQRAALYQTAK